MCSPNQENWWSRPQPPFCKRAPSRTMNSWATPRPLWASTLSSGKFHHNGPPLQGLLWGPWHDAKSARGQREGLLPPSSPRVCLPLLLWWVLPLLCLSVICTHIFTWVAWSPARKRQGGHWAELGSHRGFDFEESEEEYVCVWVPGVPAFACVPLPAYQRAMSWHVGVWLCAPGMHVRDGRWGGAALRPTSA